MLLEQLSLYCISHHMIIVLHCPTC